jgi:Transposase DDE domain
MRKSLAASQLVPTNNFLRHNPKETIVEHQLWRSIIAVLVGLSKPRKRTGCEFSDEDIVKVYYWAVIHDRPTCWACERRHWPVCRRRQTLPSAATMSRRLRSGSVRTLLNALEQRVVAPKPPGLFWMIDGKPLAISGCSKDRQAGYGRAANCKAKGYKIHALVDPAGAIAMWRVAPMNKDERVMAQRLVRTAPVQGYLVGDSNYDSNPLHEACGQRDQLQLVTRRRNAGRRGIGHHRQTPGRLRSIQLLENPYPKFGEQLLHDRSIIERRFAHVTNWGGGLTCLPPWVRTHRRVHRWVQAKLVLTALKRSFATTTCAA